MMKPHVYYVLIVVGIGMGAMVGSLCERYFASSASIEDPRTHIDTLGKTHFIIGHTGKTVQSSEEDDEQPQTVVSKGICTIDNLTGMLTCPDGTVKQVLFSPDDNLENVLVNLINNEQQSLKVAVFSFTNGAIAQALISALERGVALELVIDSSCLKDRFNKVELLQAKGIVPYIYKPSATTILSDIMHNKFIIFGKNVNNKPLVWTGSFNFTKSAQLKNQENVVILDEQYLIQKYEKQFEVIKKRISQLSSAKIAHAKPRRNQKNNKKIHERIAIA